MPRTIPPYKAKLSGPTLKLARAKHHLGELESAIQAFFESSPYELVSDHDPKTGDYLFRVRVHKTIPCDWSVIAGDVAHNLRSALDQMVCGLVRANRKQVSAGNGFPIMGSAKKFDDACIGKLKNVSIEADRFIRRLKPYNGGNRSLWILGEMNNMDKHNDIVPVAAGQVQMSMQIGVPGMFLTPEGGVSLLGGPPGSVPFGYQWGWFVPDGAKFVELVNDNCEIYRGRREVSEFAHNVQASIQITLGKTKVTNGEPLVETLKSLVNLVERILYVVETRIL